jgi:hypothetical protein
MKLSTAKSYFEDFHKDGEADKFIDLFPVDKYRTDNISIPLFKFDYSAFPVQSSHISYFDKNLKNPKPKAIPLEERVPLTHYKTDEIKQPHVEDVFENNIIQNQKNIKFPRKELPEKYAYGLDHKSFRDIAYERLDIENGDANELSRNLENFYENQYLKQVAPGMLEELESATKSFEKHVGDPTKVKTASKAFQRKQEIEVEIPEILGKVPKYHDDDSIYKKYKTLQNKADRVLSQKELYEINNMLISNGEKPLPVGTRSKAAARKLNLIDDHYRQGNDIENAITKVQSKFRQTRVKNLKKDPEFQKNVKLKLNKKQTSLGGFEESKASEHDDFFDPRTEERREKKIQEKNRKLAEREEAKRLGQELVAFEEAKRKKSEISDKWQSMAKKKKKLNDNIMSILKIDETERKGKNKESWQKLGNSLLKSRRKKAAEEQLKEDEREDAATKIQSKYRQNKAMKQQQLNLVPLGEQQVQVREKVSKPTQQFEGDEFIPKGTPSELLNKYINLRYQDKEEAEKIREEMRKKLSKEQIKNLVNNSPKAKEVFTAKQRKKIKEELDDDNPLTDWVETSLTPKKLDSELQPDDETPVPPSLKLEPLTIKKLNEMKEEYTGKQKLKEEHRKTLNLYGFHIDGRKNAIDQLAEATEAISKSTTKLKGEMNTKSMQQSAGGGGVKSGASRIPNPKTSLGPAVRGGTKTNKAGRK